MDIIKIPYFLSLIERSTLTKNQNFLKVAITITFLIEIGLNLNSMYAHELMSRLIYNRFFSFP
jgi:hypothetical protein